MLLKLKEFNDDDFFSVVIVGKESSDISKPDFREQTQSENHHNKAVEHAIDYLNLNYVRHKITQQKIGILVCNRPKYYEPIPDLGGILVDKYVAHPSLCNNIYSHILADRSNWVTVKEALTYLKKLKDQV